MQAGDPISLQVVGMARKCGLLLLVLAAAVATPQLFAAPATGAISGFIKSSAGAPQSSAVVEISA